MPKSAKADCPTPRALVLGASGMLGYAVAARLNASGRAVRGTVRGHLWTGKFRPPCSLIYGIDAAPQLIEGALDAFDATVVVNCIGMRRDAPDRTDTLADVNAHFPHALAEICRGRAAKLVHISTDAVFDGVAGGYDERAAVAPQDSYAQTKAEGEIRDLRGALTIRTSMIGLSPLGESTLVDWLLATGDEPVRGYDHALFSGLTVTEIARFIDEYLIDGKRFPRGLLHLAGKPISKFTLLQEIRRAWNRDAGTIRRDATIRYDRSLKSIRDDILLGYVPPTWPRMLAEMKSFYEQSAQSPGYE